MRVAVAMVAVVAAAGVGCITDRVLVTDAAGDVVVDDDVVKRAKARTEQARGLPFRRDVPLEVLTVAELETWLNRYYDGYQVSLARQDRFFHKLGIMAPTRDTASVWKGFVGGFAGGIYDDNRPGPDGGHGTMLLISDYAWWARVQLDLFGLITGVDYAYEVFLVHELTHALQDQHLQLGRLLEGGDDDDKRMVRKAIIESEANVIGMAHFAGIDLTRAAPRTGFFLFQRYNNLLNGPTMAALSGRTPSFFARQGFSQYELGLGFVEERLNAGDWRRFSGDPDSNPLDELSRDAVRVPGTEGAYPESTEQLLFPWKRGAKPDRPVAIAPLPLDAVPDAVPDAAVGETPPPAPERRFQGLTVLDSGVFGALALKHWIEGPLQVGAEPVVDGWGGDRYELLTDDDDETLLFWRLLGDSDDDAEQIRRALVDRLRAAHGPAERLALVVDDDTVFSAVVAPAPEERRFIRTMRPEHLRVERRGRAVVVVLGLKASTPLGHIVDGLFALCVPGEASAVDDARRQEAARELDKTLQATLATRPAPTAPSLHGQLVLPARTMALRLGAQARTTVTTDATTNSNRPDATIVIPEVEARWGVRPFLELSVPLAATVHTELGPFMVATGVQPRATPILSPLEAPWSARAIVTASWAVGDLGAALQLESAPQAFLDAVDTGTTDVAARAGVIMRPLPWLLLQPAIEIGESARSLGPDAGPLETDTVRLGGVLQRGFVDAPLVEVDIVAGLRLTLTGSVSYKVPPVGPGARVGLGLSISETRVGLGASYVF